MKIVVCFFWFFAGCQWFLVSETLLYNCAMDACVSLLFSCKLFIFKDSAARHMK
jgi:hypothetical protein